MAEPIEANYIPDGDDWTITIKGRGRTLKATAPGIIAARDRTDQLVEELAPDDEYRTVAAADPVQQAIQCPALASPPPEGRRPGCGHGLTISP